MFDGKITLAIETAIGGGSITLFDKEAIFDTWFGEREVSRSEELIAAISEILRRNNLKPSELNQIAVSRGPGSFTGARIGLATALGLKSGLSIQCFGVSILDAFHNNFGKDQNEIMTAVSFGKNEVCFRYYDNCGVTQNYTEKTESNRLKLTSIDDLVRIVNKKLDIKVVTNEKLYFQILSHTPELNPNLINAGFMLSDYIGLTAMSDNGSDKLTPYYLTY